MHEVRGKSILKHVYDSVQKCTALERTIITTGDRRLLDIASDLGCDVVYSSGSYRCGTDRIVGSVRYFQDYDIIVNVQCDQVNIPPKIIDDLVRHMRNDPGIPIASLRSASASNSTSVNEVKVEVDSDDFAVDFYRELPRNTRVYHHAGIYAYTMEILEFIGALRPTKREIELHLEQLRWLANDIAIKMYPAEELPVSINVPSDIEKIYDHDR